MKNILVVSVNWLGDAVFSTPVFRALKVNYPGARITCLCVPRVADVLAMCPDIDEIMVFDERGRDQSFFSKVSVIIRIFQKRFDAENIQSKMNLQVHDELNFDLLKSETDQVKQIVREEMEHAVELTVPLEVEMAAAENWLLAH